MSMLSADTADVDNSTSDGSGVATNSGTEQSTLDSNEHGMLTLSTLMSNVRLGDDGIYDLVRMQSFEAAALLAFVSRCVLLCIVCRLNKVEKSKFVHNWLSLRRNCCLCVVCWRRFVRTRRRHH